MKNLIFIMIACMAGLSCADLQSQDKEMKKVEYGLVIHGGAGTISKDLMTPEKEKAYRKTLQTALDAGEAILKSGGSSLDAVEKTIHVLEDSPLFNAGKGAVFTHEETAELDASFMDGKTLNAGAIAGVKTVRNPISAARMVMDSSVHVMLAGAGADEFAKNQGLEIVENDYFYTDYRYQQLMSRKGTGTVSLDHSDDKDPVKKKHGTVGAVALDKAGNLAAGTSTGGMTNKRWGRVGDAPIIGAGTYANNESCAVSCTGHGEYYIRNVVAYDVSARMLYKGESLQTSTDYIINDRLKSQGGTGGLIAIDKNGNIAMPFNTPGMFRGYVSADGSTEISIYE